MVKLSLDGIWEMRSEKEQQWMQAKVPGSVYQNLLEAGRIEDPFYRENEIGAKEVSEKDYFYRRTFLAEKELLSMDRVVLCCEGIDTIAEIFINGESVLKCDNMHRTWEAEISPALHEGENEILVHFTSPYTYQEVVKAKHPDMDLEGHLFQAHLQMRKAAYMFGWDWGPALADMGIWKSIGICGYEKGRILQLKADQVHGFEKVTLKCSMETERFGAASQELTGKISVFDPEGELLCVQEAVDGKAEFEIRNPRLWWCAGYGEQPLYRIKAELVSCDGTVLCESEKKIGLRTLKLCQEKDTWGSTFCFEINGVEVFVRGADYIPEDSLLGRCTPKRSRKLIDSCVKANFNMIRVWGGGVYPSDEFLDYCDEKGIMIWQDFMFANIVSIWSGEEKENMTREIIQQTRRFRDHACIALLCGNNETEMMIWEDMNPKYKEMYIRQYEVDMPAIVEREAPGICYWPSSPSATGSMKDTENENYGDSHDWRVWHGELPFTHYRSTFPRFNSEFGLQSFPCMKTIESFTLLEDRNIFSYVMENHQKSKNGNRVINSYVSQYFKFPKDFRALIYLSQMIQMEGIRYGVEHWRRNRNDRRCMGTLFWQINDCWPVASWSSIDSFGRWKGLQYGAKRFYEPVLVSACEEGTTVDLYVSNETLISTRGTVKWKLFHVKNGLVKEAAVPCQVRRLHTERIAHLELDGIIKTRQDAREYYLAYSYESEGRTVGEGTVLFVQAKHFEFPEPEIVCEKTGTCTWKISSKQFAKFVEVDFGEDILLSDNYFDLVPGQEKYITLEREAENQPEIYSLYDSFEK
ncbi:glycoside hydrolase family 2 protein [Ruminococcus sp. 5_1_39BFAA]|uniref:beta-mannosidase n=1 Tax=Ruminococcus sp. 5_1_39BFAA TaxID=457412 RepID=UPI00356225DA